MKAALHRERERAVSVRVENSVSGLRAARLADFVLEESVR